MATRNAMIGTAVVLSGVAGLGVAAVTSGAPDGVTPLRPAAETTEIRTQTQEVRTTEDRPRRVHARKADDGRTMIQQARTTTTTAATPTPMSTTTTSRWGADDGPAHDLGDDHGRELERGDDRGHDELEPGDDHGGDREREAGNDHGGNRGPGGSNSGHGGSGSRDD